MASLHLVGAFSDVNQAKQLATDIGGHLLCDERGDTSHLPYAALVLGVTDDRAALSSADVGTYLVCERVIKSRQASPDAASKLPGVVGVFTMVARPGLTHTESDSHWRDNHAPLALEVHLAMSNYRQLSIMHCFNGPDWDGFALCGFESEEDLRERFFATPEGRQAIAEDVAKFADPKSPRRIIATEYAYAS
ncbi:MAG: EthD domain-containing protein [Pseudomonadota bacterium]